MEIKGARFLVTGGSSGIGKATAQLLVKLGGKVAITGRDKDKLEKVANEIGALGIHADVADDNSIAKTFTEFLAAFGKLDCLINNAGIGGKWSLIEDLTREEIEEVYQVNVYGAAIMGARAAQLFKEQKSGNIINIASTASLKGFARGTVYASSKFALRGMTQCWQAELRPYNVRVIQINPSEVPTAFAQDNREERADESNKLSSLEIAHTIVSTLTMDNRGYVPEVSIHATNPF